mmetsp:Transcript_93784/g.183895  ORF Transcript_93784/g.183895 Transcript_93784/m.183895 type:complete len:134 (+) Transcript_93784:30-431(+)
MSRFVSIAKALCKQQSRFVVATGARQAPVQFVARAYTVTFPRFEAHKDEPFLDTKVVLERVIEVIKNFEKVNHSKVSPTATFKDDLDLDSLDAVEVVMALEEEFCIEIPDSEADKIKSIPEAVAYISGHPMAK